MNVLYDQLSYDVIERALASGKPVVAILPVGATESHGPHLPLNTDVVISLGIAKRCAAKLNDAEYVTFVLPPLAYTPAEYASGFAGTISIKAETLAATIDDIATSLKSKGFACLAIANSHFDPVNVGVLREASKRIEESGLALAFADATRRSIAELLTDEFKSGDCHGGQYETSIVLAEAPELVNRDAMAGLASVNAGLIDAIKRGDDTNFKTLGMQHSYCGSPAAATSEEGERSLELLAGALTQSVIDRLTSQS